MSEKVVKNLNQIEESGTEKLHQLENISNQYKQNIEKTLMETRDQMIHVYETKKEEYPTLQNIDDTCHQLVDQASGKISQFSESLQQTVPSSNTFHTLSKIDEDKNVQPKDSSNINTFDPSLFKRSEVEELQKNVLTALKEE